MKKVFMVAVFTAAFACGDNGDKKSLDATVADAIVADAPAVDATDATADAPVTVVDAASPAPDTD